MLADTYNILSDEEKSAAKEIQTGKKSIHIFNYNDRSLIGLRLITDPNDYQAKQSAGNLALDDERGMERGLEGGGLINLHECSNEAEGEFDEEEKKAIEEFKEIGDIDARVKVTKKRRSVSVRHLPNHKKGLRKFQSEEVREVKQQLADIYEVESYKEYNRLPRDESGDQTADELFSQAATSFKRGASLMVQDI